MLGRASRGCVIAELQLDRTAPTKLDFFVLHLIQNLFCRSFDAFLLSGSVSSVYFFEKGREGGKRNACNALCQGSAAILPLMKRCCN